MALWGRQLLSLSSRSSRHNWLKYKFCICGSSFSYYNQQHFLGSGSNQTLLFTEALSLIKLILLSQSSLSHTHTYTHVIFHVKCPVVEAVFFLSPLFITVTSVALFRRHMHTCVYGNTRVICDLQRVEERLRPWVCLWSKRQTAGIVLRYYEVEHVCVCVCILGAPSTCVNQRDAAISIFMRLQDFLN